MSEQLLALRDYQTVTIERLMEGWREGRRRQAAVLPTGAGKTVIFAHLIEQAHAVGARALVLAHRDELIMQAADKLHQVAPRLRVGIVKGTRNEVTGVDAVVASVQSLAREPRRLHVRDRLAPRLLVVDECHHAVASTYMSVIQDLGGFETDPNRGALVAGFTATLARADRVALGQVWEDVAHRVDILDLINRGFLLMPRGRRVKIEGLNLGRVKRVAGDYSESALGHAMSEALAPAAIARAYVQYAKDRSGLAFLPTVELAYEQAEAFRAEGITAVAVDGNTPMAERRAAIEDSRAGRVQVICNAMLFTEGTDMPWVSCVVTGRMTSSGPLYVQMVGRGLRPYPGQRDALILDPTGVGGKHRLASLVDLSGADREEELPEDLFKYEDDEDGILLGEDDGYGSTSRPEGVDGPLTSEMFDLFGGSHQAWLRTARGVWFLDVDEHLVFIAPGAEVGRYAVGRCPKRKAGGEWIEQDLELSYAMSWGEQAARGVNLNWGTTKGAGWRRGLPSQGQRDQAARWGVLITPDMTRGALSDAISTAIASSRLDSAPVVASVHPGGYW